MWLNILGGLVLLTGILDSIKYLWLAEKVIKNRSSKDISRKFLNVSILSRIFLLAWSILQLQDWIVGGCCIIALLTLMKAYYHVYRFYPFKNRRKQNFKRPPLWYYILHSFLPNKLIKQI